MLDVDKIRKDFPMIENNPDLVYLDSAATSLKPQCVIDAVVDFMPDIHPTFIVEIIVLLK